MKMKKVTYITKENPVFRQIHFMKADENHRLTAEKNGWRVEAVSTYTR